MVPGRMHLNSTCPLASNFSFPRSTRGLIGVSRTDAPVVSLAVLADDDPTWHPQSFGYELWACSALLRFPTVKLWALDPLMLAATANPMATVTLIHRDAQQTRHDPEERMQRKLAHFRACLRQGYTGNDLRHLYRLLDQLLRLPAYMDAPARATMRQIEEEEVGMSTFVTSIERLARDEGKAEGQQQLVLRLLMRKIGVLDAPMRAQVEALDPEALLQLSEALLDFTTSDDLAAWLAQA